MPSPVHESITSIFLRGFNFAIADLPDPVCSNIDAVSNQDFKGFEGQYRGSKKTPDLAVLFTNAAGDREAKFILEVGFSETYEKLVQDAKMWLEGKQEVSVLVLVK